MTVTPDGVTGDVSRGDGGSLSSRAVAAFFSGKSYLPGRVGELMTPVEVFFNGDDGVDVEVGDFGCRVEIHTTTGGLDVLIGRLMAAKVRIGS